MCINHTRSCLSRCRKLNGLRLTHAQNIPILLPWVDLTKLFIKHLLPNKSISCLKQPQLKFPDKDERMSHTSFLLLNLVRWGVKLLKGITTPTYGTSYTTTTGDPVTGRQTPEYDNGSLLSPCIHK